MPALRESPSSAADAPHGDARRKGPHRRQSTRSDAANAGCTHEIESIGKAAQSPDYVRAEGRSREALEVSGRRMKTKYQNRKGSWRCPSAGYVRLKDMTDDHLQHAIDYTRFRFPYERTKLNELLDERMRRQDDRAYRLEQVRKELERMSRKYGFRLFVRMEIL
jgi:hypothetical protein